LGVLAEARALRAQAAALADLLGMAAQQEARGRGAAPVPPVRGVKKGGAGYE